MPADPSLAGARVAVFGGSSGIGLATAMQAHAAGAEVTLISRNPARLQRAAAQIGQAATAVLDLRDAKAVAAFFVDRAPFDHVVVSAAELTAGPLRKGGLDEARAAIDSKFWGAVHVAHAARIVPMGSLTLVSGMLGARPSGQATILSAINAALDALTKALAQELAPVRVNCVSPGRIDSPWWDGLPQVERDALFARTAASLPVQRIGHPEEIAAGILAAMTIGFMTGSVLAIDGGGPIA